MRTVGKVLVVVMILLFFVPQTVSAGDYVSDALEALKVSSVYVAPGTPGTDNDTAGKLGTMLKSNDNIVLIMLPAEAGTETDIYTLAKSLSEGLGDQRIIGLAVGNDVIGYAPSLPTGVAADQMRRADSVANEPVTALCTFAQNMHIWLAAHPQATPTPQPAPVSSSKSQPWLLWVIFSVAGVAVVVTGFFLIHNRESGDAERTRFLAPDQVKNLLSKVVKKRDQIYDKELRRVLYQMCVDIEKYFMSSCSDEKRDSLFFRERLTEVNDILTKYIEVQNNPRYYSDPESLLNRGKSSITDFSVYVLESIRRGNTADLLDFKVNTNILQAQRFS